ncbi:MAG: uridine diphosphate-N-acetylglucosamine-binding protein YvcK [Candidatus Solibacter usitatus]|nr:uridine diphosphate-N-acetylglucosamine-binding protein YvcK [Candidatus Solibacter usitatus]
MSEDKPLRIVAIGGGTGLSALLHGLKRYTRPGPPEAPDRPLVDITAVVTVTDDGGSSGRLRRDFEVLPPGDIRNCMVALSEDEALLARLFQYRFQSGRGLKGHSFGNLFLTAMSHITGDFHEAVKISSEVLRIAGSIYPATASNVALEAVLEDGTLVAGESRISRSRRPIDRIRLRPRRCKPLKETLAAIAAADLITLGPGSLFTSVIPNLLVDGVPDAIRRSQAVKAYFVNLMWQPGETMQYRASDHVRALYRHSVPDLVDYAVVNIRNVRRSLQKQYARQHARPVELDFNELNDMGLEVVAGNLLQESEKVRHNPEAVASVAVQLAREGRLRRELAAHEAEKSIWKRR